MINNSKSSTDVRNIVRAPANNKDERFWNNSYLPKSVGNLSIFEVIILILLCNIFAYILEKHLLKR